jgi:hypothetical protein
MYYTLICTAAVHGYTDMLESCCKIHRVLHDASSSLMTMERAQAGARVVSSAPRDAIPHASP